MEEQLIITIEKYPIIYDKSLSEYKSSNARENVWKDVAKEMELEDIENLKKRWRSLRDAFIKHYRLGKISKSGSAGVKKKKWIYYDQMLFLIPHIEFKETIGNYYQDEVQRSSIEEPTQDNSNENIPLEETDIRDTQDSQRLSENPASTPKTKLKSTIDFKKQKRNSSTVIDQQLLEIITKKDDSEEQFMLSCVPILKRLTPRNNRIAKMQIQSLLFNLEFENTPDSRPSTSMSTFSSTSTSVPLTRRSFSPVTPILSTITNSENYEYIQDFHNFQ